MEAEKNIRSGYRAERRAAKRAYRSQKKENKAERHAEKRDYRAKKRAARVALRAEKKTYRREKRALRGSYRERLDEYYETDEFRRKANPPRRSVLEEIGNAVTHGIGSALSVAALALMLVHSRTVAERVSACVYFFGLFAMFTMSCLYHSFRWGRRVKRVFRRFDYSSIYLLIGATFTPILLAYLGGVYGVVFCAVQWAVIAAGITFVGVFGPAKLRWLHIPLYLILGWSALLFIPKMIVSDLPFFLWILGGGIVYSLGIIPFAIDKKVSHFLWHFFVLAGAIIHWFGIYRFLYLK